MAAELKQEFSTLSMSVGRQAINMEGINGNLDVDLQQGNHRNAKMLIRSWPVLILAISGCSEPAKKYSGVEPQIPEILGAGVISTEKNQTFPAIDPVTGELWFSEYEDDFDLQTIRLSHLDDGVWQTPIVAPFSGDWSDRAPRFSPDGSSILFTSNRPRPGSETIGDMNIWHVDRDSDGWSEPEFVEGPVNSVGNDIHASQSATGTWLASNREGSLGRSDLYRIGDDGSIVHPAQPLNDEHSQPDLWVSVDETWMILAITDRSDGFGGDDLYVSTRQGNEWSNPVNLGPGVNTPEYEYGPTVSPDQRFLYYTSHRAGPSHVYRVPLSVVQGIIDQR